MDITVQLKTHLESIVDNMDVVLGWQEEREFEEAPTPCEISLDLDVESYDTDHNVLDVEFYAPLLIGEVSKYITINEFNVDKWLEGCRVTLEHFIHEELDQLVASEYGAMNEYKSETLADWERDEMQS